MPTEPLLTMIPTLAYVDGLVGALAHKMRDEGNYPVDDNMPELKFEARFTERELHDGYTHHQMRYGTAIEFQNYLFDRVRYGKPQRMWRNWWWHQDPIDRTIQVGAICRPRNAQVLEDENRLTLLRMAFELVMKELAAMELTEGCGDRAYELRSGEIWRHRLLEVHGVWKLDGERFTGWTLRKVMERLAHVVLPGVDKCGMETTPSPSLPTRASDRPQEGSSSVTRAVASASARSADRISTTKEAFTDNGAQTTDNRS